MKSSVVNIVIVHYLCRKLVQELSYDAWGRLRNPETRELYSLEDEPTPMFGRGFTGHEHIAGIRLVNMNARLYDPMTGRMLSPDPIVQSPYFSQNHNRHSYCLNNPLAFTDPTGLYITHEETIKELDNILERLYSRMFELRNQFAKSNIYETIDMLFEVQGSIYDIYCMYEDPEVEYVLFVGLPDNEIVSRGNIVAMYCENRLASIIHEIRHGGQFARREMLLDESNYSAYHEIDAYRAQYSINGIIIYPIKYEDGDQFEDKIISDIYNVSYNFLINVYENGKYLYLHFFKK